MPSIRSRSWSSHEFFGFFSINHGLHRFYTVDNLAIHGIDHHLRNRFADISGNMAFSSKSASSNFSPFRLRTNRGQTDPLVIRCLIHSDNHSFDNCRIVSCRVLSCFLLEDEFRISAKSTSIPFILMSRVPIIGDKSKNYVEFSVHRAHKWNECQPWRRVSSTRQARGGHLKIV
jgi:hypothetical protein